MDQFTAGVKPISKSYYNYKVLDLQKKRNRCVKTTRMSSTL